LLSIQASVARLSNVKLDYVIVYKGLCTSGTCTNTDATGKMVPTATCKSVATTQLGVNFSDTNAHGDATDKCNVYSRAQVAAMVDTTTFMNTNFGPNATSCGSTSWDHFYCPVGSGGRSNDPTTTNGPDFIGVYVQASYTPVTKLFGSSTRTFNETA